MSATARKKTANIFLALPDPIRRLLAACGLGTDLLRLRDELYASEALKILPPAARERRIRDLIRDFKAGLAIGSHIPGFFPFLAENPAWQDFPDLHYRAKNAPSETIFELVSTQTASPPLRIIRLALHIHAYYLHGLDALRQSILINKTVPDLFVTAPLIHRKAVMACFKDYPRALTFIPCENLGRDILPFLEILPKLTPCYDLIGHIHIKQSRGSSSAAFTERWSSYLLGSLIGDSATAQAAIDNIARDFCTRPTPPALYLPHMMDALGWEKNRAMALDLASDLGHSDLPQRFIFSAGTMFWGSSAYLACFQSLDRDWPKLAKEPLARDGTVLHAIERLFGAIAIARKQTIVIAPPAANPFVFSEKVMDLCERR